MSSTVTVDHRPAESATEVTRRLIVAWEHPETRAISPVGILTFDGSSYSFAYIHSALDVVGFRPLLGFPDLHRRYRSGELFPFFAQRVMDSHRPDYARYVHRLGLDSAEFDPWEQLARSEGARQGDTIQLLPWPGRDEQGTWRCRTLVHGLRWMSTRATTVDGVTRWISRVELESALGSLTEGEVLTLVAEPSNAYNPRAMIVVDSFRTTLGYLPDLLTEGVSRLIQSVAVTARVLRVNGPEAPAHLRLMMELSARAPDDFEFFGGHQWQTLA